MLKEEIHPDLVVAINRGDYKTISKFLNSSHYPSDSASTTERVTSAWIDGYKECERINLKLLRIKETKNVNG